MVSDSIPIRSAVPIVVSGSIYIWISIPILALVDGVVPIAVRVSVVSGFAVGSYLYQTETLTSAAFAHRKEAKHGQPEEA